MVAGLVIVAAFAGWLTGRLVSPPARAASVAVLAVALGLLGIWLYGRIRGRRPRPDRLPLRGPGPARRDRLPPGRAGSRRGGLAMTGRAGPARRRRCRAHAPPPDRGGPAGRRRPGRRAGSRAAGPTPRRSGVVPPLPPRPRGSPRTIRGRPIGFAIGYRSPDHPDEAVLHLVAVHPSHRRRGIGRALVDSFLADVRGAGDDRDGAAPGPVSRARSHSSEPSTSGLTTDPAARTLRNAGLAGLRGDGEDRVVFIRRTALA